MSSNSFSDDERAAAISAGTNGRQDATARACALNRLDDTSLASALAQGEHDALTIMFIRHSPAIFRIATRILADRAEAEEIVQQVFLEAFRDITKFDPQTTSLRRWLFKRAESRALDRKRYLEVRQHYNTVSTDSDDGTQAEVVLSPHLEAPLLVQELLKKLPHDQRQLIELRYFQGLTTGETAAVTGKSRSTVKQRLVDALRQMRERLNGKSRGDK